MRRTLKLIRVTLVSIALFVGERRAESTDSPSIHVKTTDLFVKPPDEAGEYRIPSLLVTQNGTLLAFCGDRHGKGDFGHTTTTLMRRSVDGGKTWGPSRILFERAATDIHPGPVIQEPATGRIIKFSRYWPARADAIEFVSSTPYANMMSAGGFIDWVTSSEDDGRTWAAPSPMPIAFPPGVVSAASGNGNHGIAMRNGRLLVQGGLCRPVIGRKKPERFLCILESEDGGQSWQVMTDSVHESAGGIREFVLAETSAGALYLNARSNGDHRKTLQNGSLVPDATLPAIQCHAGLATTRDEGGTLWAFTHPTPPVPEDGRKLSFRERRQRMSVRLSHDEGESWGDPLVIDESPAAYSDAAFLPDGRLAIVYEAAGETAHLYRVIRFAIVDGIGGSSTEGAAR